MSAGPLPPPIPVNATIRLFRWCFLAAGVFYGFNRQLILTQLEIPIKAEAARQKVIRDQKLAEERKIAADAEIAYFEAIANPPKKHEDDYDDDDD